MTTTRDITKRSSLSPVEHFENLRQDYNAARSSRFRRIQRGMPGGGSGADYHYRSEGDYLKLIEMSRDFERNDPVIRAGFNRLVANVVQDGFTLDVQTGDESIDPMLADRWQEYSEDRNQCDIAGELAFKQQEALAFRSILRDGDVLAVPLNTGHLKWYEAHRIRTPRRTARNVVHGVLLDQFRRKLEFWATRDDIDPWRYVDRVADMRRIPAYDAAGNRAAFHLHLPDRLSQTRGIPVCAPVCDAIGMHDDIQFAKMVQQQAVSAYCVFRKRDKAWTPNTNATETGPTTEDYSLGFRRVLETMSPGIVGELGPGEDIVGFSPNVPNPEFFQHALLILQFIAINLDLPVQVLLLDPTRTNFSGWRGAIDQARIRFKQLQKWLISQFHTEVYRWKVRQWLATDETLQDAFRGGLDIFKHQWNPPAWDYIEPKLDAEADGVIAGSGLNSRRRILAKRGLEHSKIAIESAEDNGQSIEAAIKEALRINTTYGAQLDQFEMAKVDWHECLALPVPAAASIKLPVESMKEEPEPAFA